jgi:signal transduction histidine kinase
MRKYQVHSFAYISIFLLIISIIVYLNIIFQENLKTDIARQFNNQQILLARGASLSIERQVDHYVKNLVTIAQLPIIAGMEDSPARTQVLSTLLEDLPREDRTVVNFQILDRHGRLRVDHSSSLPLGSDLSDNDYFEKARHLLKGEVSITGLRHKEELNPSKRYVIISTPLVTARGFNGVALFSVSVDDIAGEYVSQIRMGKKGYAWVMDSHGTLVFHPARPEMIGRNLTRADKSCFGCHKSFDAEKKILEGSLMEYGVYTTPMGEDKLISYSRARVGQESWFVCVTIPYSEVTGLIAQSMRFYQWLISIIFFTVIGTSVFFIVLIKKKTAADERARYAAELEDRIRERTAELTAEKEKLNAILSGFGVGVSLLDRDYNVHWANEVITAKAPYAVGKKCFEAYRNRTAPCVDCPMPAVLASGKLEHVEVACRKPAQKMGQAQDYYCGDLLTMLSSENVGYFQIVIAPIKDGSRSGVRQVVELIQDVSGVKKLEQQMMHSEKLAALGRISAGIAHEIGNPLTSIYSFIQILQGNKYDEFTNSTLDTVAFHINRIKEILQQMSGFSRSYQMEKAPVDVNEAVKATLDLMGGHGDGLRGCQLLVHYNPGRLMVMADEKWLVSVFVNLIINALDAMPDKGRLTVRTYGQEWGDGARQAVVEVSDTGIGIPPEDIEKIFDPFYTTKDTGKGTGLGLAVSYSIIKDLKGDISVVSQPGEGATFTIRLPILEAGADV